MEEFAVVPPTLWDQLSEEEKRNVIETLARLIAKSIVPEKQLGS